MDFTIDDFPTLTRNEIDIKNQSPSDKNNFSDESMDQ